MIKAILITIGLMFLFFIGLLLMPNEIKEVEVIVYRNNTIIVNQTKYINTTVYNQTTIYINTTKECPSCQYKTSYVLGLIRQLKRYEREQDKYYNYNTTICYDDLNQSNIELDECQEEMCLWYNISWC